VYKDYDHEELEEERVNGEFQGNGESKAVKNLL